MKAHTINQNIFKNIFRLNGVSSGTHTTRRLSSLNLTGTPPLRCMSISASLQELDLSEDNVKQVLLDAREKACALSLHVLNLSFVIMNEW